MNSVLRHLRRAALLDGGAGLPDGQLLEGFLVRHDEAAFEALLRRHGPMVLGVCRRVLRQEQDAEDAFQATFLVLVRKASTIRPRDLVGAWLYGVAYRTAMKARTMSTRRRAREERAGAKRPTEAAGEGAWEDLLPLLDQELSQLPDKYRVPVVLCDLEGHTRREAARRLKVPEGTLSGRLTTARKLLARRLARYGLAVSGGALASALFKKTASACVPSFLQTSTLRAAVQAAAGQALTAGAVPARVVALTDGVVKTMFLMKLRAVVAVVMVVCVGAGVVGLAYRTTAAEPSKTAGAPGAGGAAQAAADDLEALRLEVEALRKSLQATRERVKTLEGEVQGLKEKGKTSARVDGEGKPEGIAVERVPLEVRIHSVPVNRVEAVTVTGVADPLAEAEAALKKLRERPDDKQATEALEKAVQRLKEQPKPAHLEIELQRQNLEKQLQQLKEQPKPENLEKELQRLKEQSKLEHLEMQLQRLKEQPKPEKAPANPQRQ
jgi:RNA polymerase sigma factor (sigma-70 family)